MEDYRGKKIVIIGLGLTGMSCINFFLERGIIPRVMDTQFTLSIINNLPDQVEYHIGSLNDKWILESDLIVVSPGVSLSSHPALKAAVAAGIEIIGDINLFCLEAKAPIIAITGSNGKSTVATLVGEMIKAAGINVGIGGNIGQPVLTLLNSSREIYVLELSSFQLETSTNLQTISATILNVTEDHMDRYPLGIQQYNAAKLRIYENTKICVFNSDDPLTIPECNNKYSISFGINTGNYHLKFQKNETWLCIKGKKVLNVKEIKISGQHNYVNALAALALADSIKIPLSSSLKVLTRFIGLPHRFQLVIENNGVSWINDSKSTNVGSTKAAISNLHVDGTLHLLLGGNGKSSDFSSLKPYLFFKNIRLYCFGKDSNKLAILRPEVAEKTKTMEQAIYLLLSRVNYGDTILLSPACSSLDQFTSFMHRGNVFTYLAKKLG